MVGSQTARLTLGPSFAHNCGCRYPNDQCEANLDIYTLRPFPMTPRTPQGEVVWAFLSSSKHSGVPEDSNSRLFQVLGFTPTLGQSRGAIVPVHQKSSHPGLWIACNPISFSAPYSLFRPFTVPSSVNFISRFLPRRSSDLETCITCLLSVEFYIWQQPCVYELMMFLFVLPTSKTSSESRLL